MSNEVLQTLTTAKHHGTFNAGTPSPGTPNLMTSILGYLKLVHEFKGMTMTQKEGIRKLCPGFTRRGEAGIIMLARKFPLVLNRRIITL